MSDRRPIEKDGLNDSGTSYLKTEDVFENIIGQLPILEKAAIDELTDMLRLLPASGKRFLLDKLLTGKQAEKILAWQLLLEWGKPVIDDLNAIIFDGSQKDEAKILANELLADMDNPVDADVFDMSLRKPESKRNIPPWQAVRNMKKGDVQSAVKRLDDLQSDARAILIHRIAEIAPEDAMLIFEQFSSRDKETALAVVSALNQYPDIRAGRLLTSLADSEFRSVQKAARKALHSMRTSGMDAPEETEENEKTDAAPEAPDTQEEKESGLPLYKAMMAQPDDKTAALVVVARQYPNGRLQAITVGMDFYKSGIRGARYYLDLSKSRLKKMLSEGDLSRVTLNECSIDECRCAVARGIRVAREVKTPLPFDLQAGKHLLGNVIAEAESTEIVYPCSACGAELPEEQLKKISATASYPQLRVETRCEKCRGESSK